MLIEFDWVPPRPWPHLPPGVASKTVRAFDRAAAAYRRQHRRYPRAATVFWDGITRVERVVVT